MYRFFAVQDVTSLAPHGSKSCRAPGALQPIVYLLDVIVLRNICVTQDYFPSFTARSVINDNRWTSTVCSGVVLYLQHLTAKDSGRQEVEQVNDSVHILAIRINKHSMYNIWDTVCWGTALQTGRLWARFPMVSLEFFIGIIPGFGVDWASNRNTYQEYFLGGEGGRCIGLATLPTLS